MLHLEDLATSWLVEVKHARSPSTLKVYRDAWHAYATFCEASGRRPVELTKPLVQAFIADQTDRCSAPTARLRLTALKVFARWLAREEDFDPAGVCSVLAPQLDERVVDHLSPTEIKAMLAACRGAEFRDLRDRALVALFCETGVRASEMLGLHIDDVSITDCVAIIRRGKGGKGRRVKFSPHTAVLLDRYLRARRKRYLPTAHDGRLWLSSRGALSYRGLAEALRTRAVSAGIDGFHLHRLRHTSAVRWLAAGGSETGLMAQHGWKSRTMVDRYVKSAREDLAAEEFDRLGLGLE